MAEFVSSIRFVQGPGTPGFNLIDALVLPPPPGDVNIGGLIDLALQRIPLPRLPLPRGPAPVPRGPRIPGIPIPVPIFIGRDGEGCPEDTCCKGFHIAKTKDPNQPSFGKCVRNRRMNALNPRALRRATRRLSSFDRMARNAKKELKKICR